MASTQMDKTNSIPNSSTRYYKSQRCKFGLTTASDEITRMTTDTDHKEIDDADGCDVVLDSDLSNEDTRKKRSKPLQSYVMMIAKAILESPDLKLSLGSIYSWIESNYVTCRGMPASNGWRNSVRHNLSLNDCFIKVGRCEDGKGNYWSIHPKNLNDFRKGNFKQNTSRRRRDRRKAVEPYISLMMNNGQVFLDNNSPLSFSTRYSDEERRAYRLDEAIMKRSFKAYYQQCEPAKNWQPTPIASHTWSSNQDSYYCYNSHPSHHTSMRYQSPSVCGLCCNSYIQNHLSSVSSCQSACCSNAAIPMSPYHYMW